jgi:integrase
MKLPHPTDPTFFSMYCSFAGEEPPKATPGSFDALIEAWKESPEWAALSPKTNEEWTRYVGRIQSAWGDLRVANLEPKHVLGLRDKYAATPAAANNLITCLSSMMSWSVPRGWRSDNPCQHVKDLKCGEPYEPRTWDANELAREWLRDELWWAVTLALYTGQRQGDVLSMRWDAIQGGIIAVAQEKTRKRLAIPIHRDLLPILERIPRRSVTILSTSAGTPWTKDGFKASWSGALNPPSQRVGPLPRPHPLWPIRLRGLVFHGLRKSAVVMLLEAGCTTAEVSSITGQTFEMVERYARQVNQRKLAARPF